MSNKVSEKEKASNNITPYENKNKKDINSLIKKRKISYPKSLMNSNNSNVIKTRQLPLLKRNKIYFNYDAFDTALPTAGRRNHTSKCRMKAQPSSQNL